MSGDAFECKQQEKRLILSELMTKNIIVTCGWWKLSLVDGFDFLVMSHKFVEKNNCSLIYIIGKAIQ